MLNDYELRKLLLKTFKLTANEFVLYVTIREIYFYWGAEHGCYASNELLAEETNTSTGTIKRSLKVLQEKNLIQVCYAKDKGFLTKRNIYPLEDDLLRIKAEGILTERKSLQDSRNEVHADHNAVQDDLRDADQVDHIININLNNNRLISPDQSAYALISHSADGSNKQSVFKEDPKPKWNDIASRYKLPTITSLTTTRIRHLKARIKEAGGESEFWAAVERSLAASPFLRGENNRGWRANFDFFMQQSSFQKVLEGAYRQEGIPRQNSELTEQEKSLKALDDYIAKLKAEKAQ